MILDRLGTITVLGILHSFSKILISSILLYAVGVFSTFYESSLLAISIFATENFHVLAMMQEKRLPTSQIVFVQMESIIANTLVILLSMTFHPKMNHQIVLSSSLPFRIFANLFFTMVIGVTLAFLASYALKSSQQKFAPHFDNFDLIS